MRMDYQQPFKDSYNGDIVLEENFTEGDKDFQAVLTKIKNADFDVLFIPGYYTEAGLIIKQARELRNRSANYWCGWLW